MLTGIRAEVRIVQWSASRQTNMLTVPGSMNRRVLSAISPGKSYYIAINIDLMDDRWILSYDVQGGDRGTAVRVCQLIFGRKNSTTKEGRPWTYDQAGFIHRPGVVWIGQSVLILPKADALELQSRLEAWGVLVGVGRLAIDEACLAVFRRNRPPRRLRGHS